MSNHIFEKIIENQIVVWPNCDIVLRYKSLCTRPCEATRRCRFSPNRKWLECWVPFWPHSSQLWIWVRLLPFCFSQSYHFSVAPDSAKHMLNERKVPSPKRNLSFAQHPLPPGPERNPGCASFDIHELCGIPRSLHGITAKKLVWNTKLDGIPRSLCGS